VPKTLSVAGPIRVLNLCSSGWRQGSILPSSLAADLAAFSPARIELIATDLVVVFSHDCDLCQPVRSKEPWVDLVLVHTLDRGVDGGLTLGKNPRVLEFEAEVDERPLVGRISAADRWLAPRELLAAMGPAGHLATIPAGLIPSWLSGRYIREGFPAEFNRRLEAIAPELRQVLKANGMDLEAIYLVMDDVELPTETTYVLVMRGMMRAERYGVAERRISAQQAMDSLAAMLSRCVGIEVADWSLVSEAEISLHDVRVMKRWSPFDTLSLSVDDIAE
jgi:hypothetical protein